MSNEVATKKENGLHVKPVQSGGKLSVFSNAENFKLATQMAQALASSTIVPRAYQNNVGNCMIAIEMASRINTSPMMVMQNLYIVNGNPAWSSQWIIAMINSSGRYKTELQFEFGKDDEDGGLSCRAWAEDKQGHKVYGPKITMKMAKDEGWVSKNGSKWKTMPEVMIRYRAASFFGRLNCPDMVMGIYSQDEVYEMGDDYNGPTGEIYEEAVQTVDEDNVLATQEQRQSFLEAISEVYKPYEKNYEMHVINTAKNKMFYKVLGELGLESASHITVGQVNKAIEIVRSTEISEDELVNIKAEEDKKAEKEPAEKAANDAEKTEEKAESPEANKSEK